MQSPTFICLNLLFEPTECETSFSGFNEVNTEELNLTASIGALFSKLSGINNHYCFLKKMGCVQLSSIAQKNQGLLPVKLSTKLDSLMLGLGDTILFFHIGAEGQ